MLETHLKALADLESCHMVQYKLDATERGLLKDTNLDHTEYSIY